MSIVNSVDSLSRDYMNHCLQYNSIRESNILMQGNTWIWNILGLQILIDPVLVGNLDFGMPWIYDASRRKLKEFKVLLSGLIILLGHQFFKLVATC